MASFLFCDGVRGVACGYRLASGGEAERRLRRRVCKGYVTLCRLPPAALSYMTCHTHSRCEAPLCSDPLALHKATTSA